MDDAAGFEGDVDDEESEERDDFSDEPDDLSDEPDDFSDDLDDFSEEPDEPEPLVAEPEVTEEPERESVRYKPPPLKTMPTALKTLRRRPSHSGHTVSESSLNDCTASKRWSHSVHA